MVSTLGARYAHQAAPIIRIRLAFVLAQLSESEEQREHFVTQIFAVFETCLEERASSLEALGLLAYKSRDQQVALAAAHKISTILEDATDPFWQEKASKTIATQGFGDPVKEILLGALQAMGANSDPKIGRASYEARMRITADYDSY
jgi:hypothetical protein